MYQCCATAISGVLRVGRLRITLSTGSAARSRFASARLTASATEADRASATVTLLSSEHPLARASRTGEQSAYDPRGLDNT